MARPLSLSLFLSLPSSVCVSSFSLIFFLPFVCLPIPSPLLHCPGFSSLPFFFPVPSSLSSYPCSDPSSLPFCFPFSFSFPFFVFSVPSYPFSLLICSFFLSSLSLRSPMRPSFLLSSTLLTSSSPSLFHPNPPSSLSSFLFLPQLVLPSLPFFVLPSLPSFFIRLSLLVLLPSLPNHPLVHRPPVIMFSS